MTEIAVAADPPAHLRDWSADVRGRAEALLALLDDASPEHLRFGLPNIDAERQTLARHLDEAGIPEDERNGNLWVLRVVPLLRATIDVATRARAEHAKRRAPRSHDADRMLLIEIAAVFEELHGQPFTVTIPNSDGHVPHGASLEWCRHLFDAAAAASAGTPHADLLRALAAWAREPHALPGRIRDARSVLVVQGRAIKGRRGRSAAP